MPEFSFSEPACAKPDGTDVPAGHAVPYPTPTTPSSLAPVHQLADYEIPAAWRDGPAFSLLGRVEEKVGMKGAFTWGSGFTAGGCACQWLPT